MSHQAEQDNPTPLLRQETSNLSDYTVDSNSTFVNTPSPAATPGSPVHHRTGYRRLASFNNEDTAYHGPRHSPNSSQTIQEYGLGIKNLKPLPSSSRASPGGPDAASSANPLLSPPLLQSIREHEQDDRGREDNGNWDDYPSKPDPYQPFVANSDTEQLHRQTTVPTVQSVDPRGTQSCTTFLQAYQTPSHHGVYGISKCCSY
ncbi:MAG: hypothetical protein LQ346_002803 [Caloplaca aetnensis]|nr:MAG: hypothetical protein LQ346_002803 [Caloplaca aetnensis]